MRQNSIGYRTGRSAQGGFSLMELIVVVAVIGILAAIAIPSFLQWRRNMEYRETARDISDLLRNAKNGAITTNRQYRVEFDVANRRYRITQGNYSNNSTTWDPVSTTTWAATNDPVHMPMMWRMLPILVQINVAQVPVAGGIPCITFLPNGTVLNGPGVGNVSTVAVLDEIGNTRYNVEISPAGRVRTFIPAP